MRFQNLLITKTTLALTLFLLAGCAGTPKEAAPELVCPTAGLMPRADTFITAAEMKQPPSDSNALFKARMGNYRGGCSQTRNGGLDYALEIDIMASRTESGQLYKKAQFPYFVAVLGPDESIISRDSFTVEADFDDNDDVRAFAKQTVHVPVSDMAKAGQYKVVAGFELTPEQYAYNTNRAAALQGKPMALPEPGAKKGQKKK